MTAKKSASKNATAKRQVCLQHMKPVSENGLGKSRPASTFPLERFSLLQTGKRRTICKECQTRLSKEWTTRRADYRKLYQQARALVEQGEKVAVPNAKEYKKGDILRYTNGKAYKPASKAATASA